MAALWSLIAVAIIGAFAIVVNGDGGPGFALVALLGWLVLLPLTMPVGKQRRLSDVAFLAGFVFFLTFGVRSIFLLLRTPPELPGAVPDLSVVTALAGFLPIHFDVLLLAIVSWAAFTLGYRLPAGPALAERIGDPRLERLKPDRLMIVTIVLAAAGWVARVAFQAGRPIFERADVTNVDASTTILSWIIVLAPTALALALLGVVWFRRHPGFIGLAVMLTLAEVGFAVLAGVRAPLFSVALAVVAFGLVRVTRPLRWLVVVLPLALMVLGATVVYRTPDVFAQTRSDDAIQRVATTVNRSLEMGPVGLTEIGLWNVSARYIGVDAVAQILLVGPPEPTWGERYLLAVPSALIPRFLWPDKPTSEITVEFAHTYLGIPSEVNVPHAPTWIGDLLLSFPLLLVPAAMLLIGLACRVLNDYGRAAQVRRSFGLVPYALLLPIAVQADAWISPGLYQVVQIMAITFALVIALGLSKGPRATHSQEADQPGRMLSHASPGSAS